MQQESSFTVNVKSETPVQVYVDNVQLEKFDLVCNANERSRAQMLRVLIRHAIVTKGAELNTYQPLPEFELLTFQQAREFLAPYYAGTPPSNDTLERRIADGTIIATKESDTRTGRRRILKASLVAWMSRLGKELESEMMP